MPVNPLSTRLFGNTTQADWSKLSVAMSGATGFLGLHLARLLRERGAQVKALVRSTSNTVRLKKIGVDCIAAEIEDVAALEQALAGCQLLFHMAGAVDFAGDWNRFRQVNVVGTQNILTAAKRAGITRAVHTSSIVAVGAQVRADQFASEESPWNLGPLQVPYVTTKREAEEAALAMNDSALEVVVANPASVIGPDDFSSSEFGTMCHRYWKGRLPIYFPGGNNFVDVRDVAQGHVFAAERGRAGERYLLTGTNLTYGAFFKELAKLSARKLWHIPVPGFMAPLLASINEAFPPKNGGRLYLSHSQAKLVPRFFYFQSNKAATELGYAPRPFSETLVDTRNFWIPPPIAAAK